MIIRDITAADKKLFNDRVRHPLQSFEWGEFRKKTGVKVIRKGIFEGKKLITPIQVTIHKVPKLNWQVGYFPKGTMPDEDQLKVLRQTGKENNCVMIKLEPNVGSKINQQGIETHAWETIDQFLKQRGCRVGRPLFTKYSFQLNLKETEEKILKKMHHKTRYNIRLAERKGVKVVRDNSRESFEWFLQLLFEETVNRQGFYAHTPGYFKKMWEELEPAGIAHLLRAEYKGTPLACFMVFYFNNKIYYPYGASTRNHRELMAPNLLMWEVIKFGKELKCKQLDMWGSLGPAPDKRDPWYGFHRYKQGYGGDLVEFLGSYDLVLQKSNYQVYRTLEKVRWAVLKSKAKAKQLPGNMNQWGEKGKKTALGVKDRLISLFE